MTSVISVESDPWYHRHDKIFWENRPAMKANCNRSALDNALATVTSVVSSRTPREVLKCARLTAKQDRIVLVGTDLEIGVRYALTQVEVEGEGDVLVSAEKLSQIVRELTDEVVALEAVEGMVHIRGDGSHFQVYGQDPTDFPSVPEFEGEADMEIDTEVLRRLIETTVFAAARENTRYAINGVLWERKGKKLQMVATDGRRLARAVGALKSNSEEAVHVIVPPKTMTLLLRVMQSAGAEEIQIRAVGSQILIHIGAVTVSSVLVEGHFPKHEDVIPKDNPIRIAFNTAELHAAIRRAALLTNNESKGIRMEFNKGGLVLSGRAPQEGEATVNLKVSYNDAPLSIGFNPGFLTDALRVVGTEEVALEISEPTKPGVLTAGKDYTYVIMPVSLA
jgi:DNA polymerase-3 subunit beta